MGPASCRRVVTNIDDPEQMGRVKVAFPWLGERPSRTGCGWRRRAAGPSGALLFLPEVGDEVLVGFAHGDPRIGFVLGGLHNGKDEPPLPIGELVARRRGACERPIVSRKGHRIVLDDTDEQILLLRPATTSSPLVLDQKGTKVVITSDGDVEIDAEAGGQDQGGHGHEARGHPELELKAATG